MNFNAVIESWVGTQWAPGSCAKGIAADCTRFVDAVVQELRGIILPPMRQLNQTMGFHDRRGAVTASLEFAHRHPHRIIRPPTARMIEPGDVLVVRMKVMRGAGPGHVLIAGEPSTHLWHCCAPGGVKRTSLATFTLLRIYRPEYSS